MVNLLARERKSGRLNFKEYRRCFDFDSSVVEDSARMRSAEELQPPFRAGVVTQADEPVGISSLPPTRRGSPSRAGMISVGTLDESGLMGD